MRTRLPSSGLALLCLVLSTTLLVSCGGQNDHAASTAETCKAARPVAPHEGEHVVVVINRPLPGRPCPSMDYLTDTLKARGLGVVEIPGSATGVMLIAELDAAVRSSHRGRTAHSIPVTLLSVGPGAKDVWRALADPPTGLVASVEIGVPGIEGIDFSNGRAVANLSLNLKSDTVASRSHHEVHVPMRNAQILHQVVVYGAAGRHALDKSSPQWDEPVARDVAQRTADWLQHRDGLHNQVLENPDT